MKKIIVFVMAIVFAIGICGCGNKKANTENDKNDIKIESEKQVATVETFLDAIKAKDKKTIEKVYDGDYKVIEDSLYPDISERTVDKDIIKILKSLQDELLNFDYKLKSKNGKGKAKVVEAKITTFDMERAYDAFYDEYSEKRAILDFEEAPEEKYIKLAAKLMKKHFTNLDKDYEGKVDIKLIKKDGNWKIAPFKENSDFFNVIKGGGEDAIIDNEQELNDAE